MDQNAELLMEIYKNSELERAVLGRLIRRCEDASFRNLMADHFTVYHTIMQEAHDELNTHGILAQEYGPFEKSRSFLPSHSICGSTKRHPIWQKCSCGGM